MCKVSDENRKMEIHLDRAQTAVKARELVEYIYKEEMEGYELLSLLEEEMTYNPSANVPLISLIVDACFIASQQKNRALSDDCYASLLTEWFMKKLANHG